MNRPVSSAPGAAAFPYPVLYRSPRLIVIDKPAGLPVHAGPKTGRTLEDAFPLLSLRKDGPWLVHRLDADTSGCVLVALRKQALIQAQAAFQGRQVRKTYWAVVEGHPADHSGENASGEINAPLRRDEQRNGWRMIVDPRGQPARTGWRVLGRDGDRSWLELTLHTGRTHQARAHCAALGCPILGDPVYYPLENRASGNRAVPLQLLSRRLEITVGEEHIDTCATPPEAMTAFLGRMGYRPSDSTNQKRNSQVSDGV